MEGPIDYRKHIARELAHAPGYLPSRVELILEMVQRVLVKLESNEIDLQLPRRERVRLATLVVYAEMRPQVLEFMASLPSPQ
jgi:hypothetical protein